jgi:CheY-like chemotaxis protein
MTFTWAAGAASNHPPHQQEGPMTTGRTILIIEDDAIQREMLAMQLRKQDFTVVTAPEGNNALHRLSSGPVPDLIMTSLSVACEAWAASLGAAGLLRKPFDPTAVQAEVRHFLGEAVQA